MKINIESEKLSQAIKEAEGKARVRTIGVEDIKYVLNISIGEDEEWVTWVDIVDKNSYDAIDTLSCYGINSPQNIADAIMNLCEWHGII